MRHHADEDLTRLLLRLTCRHFRNLEAIDWEPGPGRHLLFGANGAGKTSLLEAIYVLATTRSFRAARLGDCCRHGSPDFLLQGRVAAAAGTDLGIGWSRDGGVTRSVNGRSGALAEHLGVLPVVGWSAAEAELVSGPPRARRRLLDQGVVGMRPAALDTIARYRRALRQKRELLARGGSGLGPWNEVLAETADELVRRRREFLARLEEALGEVLGESALALPRVTLRYRPSPPTGGEGREATREAFERARRRERECRAPLVGPHRDEVEIAWGGHPARVVASAGERKLLGLSLAAARGRVLAAAGREPLYLLDDVDAELDPARLRAAWALFTGCSQLFASSNRRAVWGRLDGARGWLLEGGRLGPLPEQAESA